MSYRVFIAAMLFSLFFMVKGYAQKTDTIYHINGDVLTGDFKKLAYGVVTWKMDGMGTISLEVPKIQSIKSRKQFEIKLKNGMMYYGSFDSSAVNRHVNIKLANGRELVSIDEIVEVYPIKRNFWKRTSGDLSLGVNYSKGSNLATISFSGDLNYRKRKSYFSVSWDDYNTYQSDTLSSTKADASVGWERTLKKRWALNTALGINQNTELGTKIRLTLGFAALHDFVYNKWNRFYLLGGISGQRETPYDTTRISNDLAGIVGAVWKVYKYTNPKVWVDASIYFIPYLTTAGRYRTNININPKISIIGNDLKIGFKFYYSIDTKPLTTTSGTSTDWGINLEITYSFH